MSWTFPALRAHADPQFTGAESEVVGGVPRAATVGGCGSAGGAAVRRDASSRPFPCL